MTERVAITGIGVFSPIGNSVSQLLDSLQSGRSGLVSADELPEKDISGVLPGKIHHFLDKAWEATSSDPTVAGAEAERVFDLIRKYLEEKHFAAVRPSKVAYVGMVKGFSPEGFIAANEVKKKDRYQQFAIAATENAKLDAGLGPEIVAHYASERIAVVAASSMGGMQTWEETFIEYLSHGPRGISPYFMTKQPLDTAAGEISRYQNANGPIECPIAACATGALVVGRGFELIRDGVADVAFSTASEASLSRLGLGGFEAIRAVTTRDYGDPTRASRPFDKDRSGFVMAEGSACLLLENLSKAKARGARIYAEIAGFGNFADAFHPTRPNPEGKYAALAMQRALENAHLGADTVGYINAHGTSTPLNDKIETKAIKRALGLEVARLTPVSSTKSMSGHLMGAAGALEAAVCALALHHQFLPPTINYEVPDPECDLPDYVPNHAREAKFEVALSNSFGFGGRDSTLAFKAFR